MKVRHIPLILFAVFLLPACSRSVPVRSIEREVLFALELGRLENQLALYNLNGNDSARHIDIAMRDGLFFISDGKGGKILRFNSFGDLLFMIYNEETNPPPLTLRPHVEGSLLTRWSVKYPLLEPGKIAVDSRRNIFVQDRLPAGQHSSDAESRARLDNVVLHFDSDGRFVKFLGREGIGGSPFPRIEGIFTTREDDLAVVCRLPTGWNIYWYDSEGFFLFMVHLANDAMPIPADRENVFASPDGIFAGPDSRKLYVKMNYYRNVLDEETDTRTAIQSDSSVIWIMDAENGVWERYVELPFFEDVSIEQNRQIISRRPYSLLGITGNEWAFLSYTVPEDGGYALLAVSLKSGSDGEQRRGFIEVNNSELAFNVFALSADGILSGLLATDWQAEMVWWRTDRFLEERF